jgi:non-reducing end alpha-L-arabinofuranosidase
VRIPAGTTLASHDFYLLGLSSSGLAAPARAGAGVLHRCPRPALVTQQLDVAARLGWLSSGSSQAVGGLA